MHFAASFAFFLIMLTCNCIVNIYFDIYRFVLCIFLFILAQLTSLTRHPWGITGQARNDGWL
jgi:hypothetical protein